MELSTRTWALGRDDITRGREAAAQRFPASACLKLALFDAQSQYEDCIVICTHLSEACDISNDDIPVRRNGPAAEATCAPAVFHCRLGPPLTTTGPTSPLATRRKLCKVGRRGIRFSKRNLGRIYIGDIPSSTDFP